MLILDEILYSLSTQAPDPDRGTEAATLRAHLRNLADAIVTETSTAQDASVDDLRDRQAAVWRAGTELRQFLDAANALH